MLIRKKSVTDFGNSGWKLLVPLNSLERSFTVSFLYILSSLFYHKCNSLLSFLALVSFLSCLSMSSSRRLVLIGKIRRHRPFLIISYFYIVVFGYQIPLGEISACRSSWHMHWHIHWYLRWHMPCYMRWQTYCHKCVHTRLIHALTHIFYTNAVAHTLTHVFTSHNSGGILDTSPDYRCVDTHWHILTHVVTTQKEFSISPRRYTRWHMLSQLRRKFSISPGKSVKTFTLLFTKQLLPSNWNPD